MPSSNATPKILALATQIGTAAKELQDQLVSQGLQSPTWDEKSPLSLPDNVSHLRDDILDATSELHELLLEPLILITNFLALPNVASIDAITRYHIADMIPPGGRVSFEEIAERSGLEKSLVRRLIRQAVAMRIFEEPEPGIVAHTKISKFLTNPDMNAWASFEARDTAPAAARILDAVAKWPSSEEPNQTAFSLANNTSQPAFEFIASDPERMMRMGTAMKVLDHVPGYATRNVSKEYDWGSLGDVCIAHIGGRRGQAAIELAKNFENVRLLVQDAATMVHGAESEVPDYLKDRVHFQEHDLFEQQTAQADIYFFRMVFRFWGDKYALKILRAQIPALRPGAKIFIQDIIMPDAGTLPAWRDRLERNVDLNMKVYNNGCERYLDQWNALLAAADPRFVLHRTYLNKGAVISTLEIHWDESGTTAKD